VPRPNPSYEPDTVDINADEADYLWLLKVLQEQIPTVVVSAVQGAAGRDGVGAAAAAAAAQRSAPFCFAFQRHGPHADGPAAWRAGGATGAAGRVEVQPALQPRSAPFR
jgi:hypothetical protein